MVGETWDGMLNDLNGFHVRPEHVHEALAAAGDGAVAEGGVGSGTGMICHGVTAHALPAERALALLQGAGQLG